MVEIRRDATSEREGFLANGKKMEEILISITIFKDFDIEDNLRRMLLR
jgi:hypothetical protein